MAGGLIVTWDRIGKVWSPAEGSYSVASEEEPSIALKIGVGPPALARGSPCSCADVVPRNPLSEEAHTAVEARKPEAAQARSCSSLAVVAPELA